MAKKPPNPLLLIGGQSTRMQQPKHLMTTPTGHVLYRDRLNMLHSACPDAQTIYVSLARDTAQDSFLQGDSILPSGTRVELVFDDEFSTEAGVSGGPALGLLAAFRLDPASSWLVLACDYPLLTAESLSMLLTAYTAPITCFGNSEGFAEPLIGIWSPEALTRLAANHAQGRSGPSLVVRQLQGKILSCPTKELLNTNTPLEWELFLRQSKLT